jgi:subtilisin family serine protease
MPSSPSVVSSVGPTSPLAGRPSLMPVRLAVALLGVALLAACGGGGGADSESTSATGSARAASAPAGGGAANASSLVLMLKAGFPLEPLLQRHGLVRESQFGQRPIYQLRAAAGTDIDRLLEALRGETSVRFAERNAQVAQPEARWGSIWAVGESATSFNNQYAPAALGLAQAHPVSQGAGVRVAVLDTGIDLTHPVLATRLARNAQGQVLGYDFVDGDADPSETGRRGDSAYGHGTHVAGLVALAAPAARLMPLRVLTPQGAGNAWVLAEALAWAMDPDGDPRTDDGAHVINLSLGSTTPTTLLKTATELATCEFDDDDDDFRDPGFDADRARCASGQRAVVVAAAGNSGSDQERLYPAAEQAKGSIAVTASTQAGQLAPFGNRGSWIAIAAPGDRITSTLPGGGYGVWSGTSMAAPLVAGTAALLLATLPKDGLANLPPQRQWVPEDAIKRITDRPVKLCGTSFLQAHAGGAVLDAPVADPLCP